jgi:small subunit ribosomal protein S7
MPRRKSVVCVRDIGVDRRFKSEVVQKFINVVMKCGKKSIATQIVYDAFDILVAKCDGDEAKGFALFEKALANIRPAVEVRSRRVGGGVYQIPTEVRASRAQALSFRWLLSSAASRSDKTMGKRIASELLDASEGKGSAFKKRLDVHRMAEANRAFSHYSW